MTKKEPFSNQMRRHIETSGQTRYRIAKETGIDAATLCRFMNGLGGLSNDKLDTLASYFGWSIVVEPKSAPKAQKG